jgi:cell division protein FtsI (penicillin-binding protein 3)
LARSPAARPTPRRPAASSAGLARAGRARLRLLSGVALVGFALLTGRLVQVQALGADHYHDLALAQRLRTVPLPAERGSIFDRNGRDLAISVQVQSIWADPAFVPDPGASAAALAPVVGVDERTLLARLSDRSRRFVYVARTVDDATADAVRALRLPGIGFVPESRRFYPAGDLAAAVLGSVGLEGHGLGGLEHHYDDELSGEPGELVVERDRTGRNIPRTVRHEDAPERGTDLVLTIEQALQYRAERSLADQVRASAAKAGTAAVVDLRNGDVLAMATVVAEGAGARPASPSERNRPLTDTFEPGSTNKVITVAAAIDAGLVGPTTELEIADSISVGGYRFRDDEPHPLERWTVSDILTHSSNVGAITIAAALGKDRLDAALRAFGLDDATSVAFPGQADGVLLDPDEYYGTGMGSVPIGYALSVSAMQILDVYATIANGGESVPPRLLAARIDDAGHRRDEPIAAGTRVVSSAAADAVSGMLERVVREGTGVCAAIHGYTVAGKTGTSRKLLPGGGYDERRHMATFVGYAPAERPRLAAIVVLDEPRQTYGGRAAAPVFAEIVQFALRQQRVVPDPTPPGVVPQWEAARAAAAAVDAECRVPHGAALEALVAQHARPTAPAAPAGTLPATTSTTSG